MERMRFEPGTTLLHVAAEALDLTPTEAEEQIIRIAGFCSLDEKNPVKLGTADLHETVASVLDDGIKAVQFSLEMTERKTRELDGVAKGHLSRRATRRAARVLQCTALLLYHTEHVHFLTAQRHT